MFTELPADLREDFLELSYLITDALWKLRQFDEAVYKHRKDMSGPMYDEATTAVKELRTVYEALAKKISRSQMTLSEKTLLPTKGEHLRILKKEIKETIRAN